MENTSDCKINKDKGFINGAFALAFSAILVKICGMFFKVPLSYILTDEGMGYFNSAYTVYSFFYILSSSGVPKAVTMLVTGLRNEGEHQAERAFKITLSLFLKIGLISTVLFLLFASPLSILIGNKSAVYTMIFIAPSLCLVCLSGVMRGYLNSYFALRFVAFSQLIEAGGKLVLGLVFAFVASKLEMSLPLISAFSTLGISIGSLVSVIYLYAKAKSVNAGNKIEQKINIDRKTIRKNIFKIAIPISLSSALLNLSGIIDLALIMHRLKASGLSDELASSLYGNYTTLAVPMLTLVVSVTTPIAIAVFPRLAEHHIRGNSRAFSRELNSSAYLMMLVSAPCFLSFLLYSESILDILYTTEASTVGKSMLSTLSIGVILLSLLTLFNTALEAEGRIRASVTSLIVGSIVKSILGYILIGRYNLSILGAPIGTVISYLVSLILSLLSLMKGGISLSFFKTIFSPLSIASISFTLPFLFFIKSNINRSFFHDVFLLFISFFIYVTLVFLTNKGLLQRIKSNILTKKSAKTVEKI